MNLSQIQYTPSPAAGVALAKLLEPFPVIRFMNWQETNGSTAATFDDCERGEIYTGGPWARGQRVPLSQCINTANVLGKRGWFCVPHLLDEENVTRFVERVVEECEHKPIIEWSNEVWNRGFPQHQYAAQMGEASKSHRSLRQKERSSALQWQAEMMKLIKRVVGDSADVVVGSQFWYPEITRTLLELCGDNIDAVAIAPYYGRKLAERAPRDLRHVWQLAQTSLTLLAHTLGEHRDIAGDLPLYAYEGGWHGAAHHKDSAERERLTALFCAYARSEFAAHDSWRLWHEIWGEGVACPYSLATTYGAEQWGHVEIVEGRFVVRPKYKATVEALVT